MARLTKNQKAEIAGKHATGTSAEALAGAYGVHPATIRRVVAKNKLAPLRRVPVTPDVFCAYDNCHRFTPGSATGRYCPECKCKRKAENSRKRLNEPLPLDPVELWKLQEHRKIERLDLYQRKNEWLLANSKIGFFDLETSNLDASIGMIICGSIKEYKGKTVTYPMKKVDGLLTDAEAVVKLRDDLEKYDYVCTYYGTRFDIPYINTRLIMHGERPINQLRHIDMYFTARFKLKLHSNRLVVVGETLFGESHKTRVMGPEWTRALMGDANSLRYITEHCEIDVAELEAVFEELRGFVNLGNVRIRRFGGSY